MDTDGKVSILLVDDQPSRLLTYESVLNGFGWNLVAAASGLEALDKLMRQEFAVVLLDVSMPDMDGFEAARLIHEHPRFEKTPIIFVTGVHVSELDRLTGYKVGAVDYVSIPVVPEILRSKVAVLVELYLKRRELRALNRTLASANEQLAAANTTLQAEKTRELETLNRVLQRANTELEQANRTLQSEIAERTRVEQALKAADRHKDEFLAMLAHELRNPLAPIRNAVGVLKVLGAQEPTIAKVRDMIDRQVTHMVRLVDDLLDVSRLARSKVLLRNERLDLTRLVHDTAEDYRSLLVANRLTLELCLPEEPVHVVGDGTRLSQVLSNVLHNASKFTDAGGSIRVTLRTDSGGAVLTVRDTGIGMDRGMLERVFETFSQADSSLDRSRGGLGLGLSLVRGLVELHGGETRAESEGLGKGTAITIRLPVAGPGALPHQQAVAQEHSAPANRVLVIEDNADTAESMRILFSLTGHEVEVAHAGRAGLDAVQTFRPQVVLCDIGLPGGMDGYAVARAIRGDTSLAEVRLIALSGYGREEDRRQSREAGFDAHLIKPVDFAELRRLLSEPNPAI
jgi:signal transduction histidine kinase